MNSKTKRTIKISLLLVFFLLVLFYVIFVSKNLIFGVKIKNVNLSDGATYEESILKITGNAKNAISLTLNGREISIDESGNFEETIALLSGYNTINLKAKDKFGHEDEKNFRLLGKFVEEIN